MFQDETDLQKLFDELNRLHFGGELPRLPMSYNSRLRSSAGRFFSGSRGKIENRFKKSFIGFLFDPIDLRNPLLVSKPNQAVFPRIEIASYLQKHESALHHIQDTLAHEMIHYWLWHNKKPFGHTAEFKAKMRSMGVSRYNPVPMKKNWKHAYSCPKCQNQIQTFRKLAGKVACLDCCKKYNGGKYHVDFELVLN
jgi:predicted SprT family Zn-dependent metalloprotease